MVRLKVATPYLTGTKAVGFQFLMVRLKARMILALSLIVEHFNSLWCD